MAISEQLHRIRSNLAASGISRFLQIFNRSGSERCLLRGSAMARDIHIMRSLQTKGGSIFEYSKAAMELRTLLPRLSVLRPENAMDPFLGWIRWRVNEEQSGMIQVTALDYEWAKEIRLLRANYSAFYPLADWDFADERTRFDLANWTVKSPELMPNEVRRVLRLVDDRELHAALATRFAGRKAMQSAIENQMEDLFRITNVADGLLVCEKRYSALAARLTIDLGRPSRGFSQRACLDDDIRRESINIDPLLYAGFGSIEWDRVNRDNLSQVVADLKDSYREVLGKIGALLSPCGIAE